MTRLFSYILGTSQDQMERDTFERCKLVVADNVLSMIDKADDFAYFKEDASDFLLAPPFQFFAIEAKSDVNKVTFLTLVHFVKAEDSSQKYPENTHWIIEMISYSSIHGKTWQYPCVGYLYVDKHGTLIPPQSTGFAEIYMTKEDYAYMALHDLDPQEVGGRMANIMSFAAYVITLMNCKNIKLEDVQLTGQQQKNNRKIEQGKRSGIKDHEYKMLSILRNVKQQSAAELECSDKRKVRFHLRRGHMKRYGEQYGTGLLFGKYEGLYYFEPTTSGNDELGSIVKDYEVK